MTETQIKELLKNKNVSITRNRIKIIQCLDDDLHFHTIKNISDHIGNLNIKSIYNNIKVLIDAGVVDAFSFSGISKFAINNEINAPLEVHIVNKKRDDVHHHELSPRLFQNIKNEMKKQNHNVKSIKIWIEVE